MGKQNTINTLEAITTLDGRYREKVEELSSFTSEKGLIAARLEVELQYLLALSAAGILRKLTAGEKKALTVLNKNFSLEDAQRVKEIEETTRHDVKAIEYFIREKLDNTSLSDICEKTHLFLTSEDVNNLAHRIVFSGAIRESLLKNLTGIVSDLLEKAEIYAGTPMLARTHGQNAVPTTVGKEFVVFSHRLSKELEKLKKFQFSGKLNGATGNYNSFHAAYGAKSYKEWKAFSAAFVESFGFVLNPVTTQINTYEDIIEALQILQRINGILIDFASDMWRYISDGWFKQKAVKTEVGSSTMPQKVNPIDFENGEGNLSLANDVIKGLCERLPHSRLQRDLRDSTQIRNIGMIVGFITLGVKSLRKGMSKVMVDTDQILEDLNKDWSILSEGAQVYLRAHEDIEDPYSLFKYMMRGVQIGQEEWIDLVQNLPVSQKAKDAFLEMTPETYTGFAKEITLEAVEQMKRKIK
ncbi:MAG: adenylosuccinate lyase [Candidatus Levyibacteriota bacterium]